VKFLSHVNDKVGSFVFSTWLGNFTVNLQENQVDLFPLRKEEAVIKTIRIRGECMFLML